MTSNQQYKGLNNRFDKRARTLRRCGWTYEKIEGYPIAVFAKRRYGKVRAIAASNLFHCSQPDWCDLLARELRRA